MSLDFLLVKVGIRMPTQQRCMQRSGKNCLRPSPEFDPYLGLNKWQLLFLLFLLNLTQFFPGQFLEPPSRESWRGLHTLSRHVPPPLLELTCVCFISSTILIQHLLNNSHYALLIEQAAWRKPVGGKELQLICTFIKQIDF